MAQIKLNVVKDICLGYQVYRGSIKASELEPATWIDFYDEELNPLGYQRPFNEIRSEAAANYAENADSFWPESILAIRDNAELEEAEETESGESVGEDERVISNFNPISPGSNFGELVVDYNGNGVQTIGDKIFKWRRAFSQVDCQHRLGKMVASDKSVTVCIIPEIKRLEEAVIFKTINDNQRKVSTSLVDAIIQLSKDKLTAPEVHLAFDLSRDVGSCFRKKVNMEGRNLLGLSHLVTLRTLRTSITSLAGGAKFIKENLNSDAEYTQFYVLVRSYWNDVRNLWPSEFNNPRASKLMTVPGLKGLARYGREMFKNSFEVGNNNMDLVSHINKVGKAKMDWSTTGPLINASGNAGVKAVFDLLTSIYGTP